MTDARRVVHVVRHGQVHNPDGVLYGRLPGFGLSDLGRRMADVLGQHFAEVPLTHLAASPLQRAQETMAPIAAQHPHLEVHTEPRVIEAANNFEGRQFGDHTLRTLLNPRVWWWFRNPLRPSWGEAYTSIALRMQAAIADAGEAAGDGGQAVVVAHQLPIWIARLSAEGRFLPHDPRRRQCSLASVTSFTLVGRTIVDVAHAEPAAHLLPSKGHSATTYTAGM